MGRRIVSVFDPLIKCAAFFLFLYGSSALATGEKIKVMASHVGPVNNPSEVSR